MPDDCDKTVSVIRHFEALLTELEKRIEEKFKSTDRAVEKAERTLNARLEGMNEFRDTLRDQAARFVTSDGLSARLTELTLRVEVCRERIDELVNSRSKLEGKIWGVSAVVGVVVGVFGTAVNLLVSFLRH